MAPLQEALDHFVAALGRKGLAARFAPFQPAQGAVLAGEFEVRAADGRVRRMQKASLPLPPALAGAFAHLAPIENVRIDLGSHALTLWAPGELIELQVGYRWHGFSGKRMPEWDERFVVFAEDGADPLALRHDQLDGPVYLSHRGEGRHAFFEAAPDLAAFFHCLALFLEAPAPALARALRSRFGPGAEGLWLFKELVTRSEARR
jgi:hypothetical protein